MPPTTIATRKTAEELIAIFDRLPGVVGTSSSNPSSLKLVTVLKPEATLYVAQTVGRILTRSGRKASVDIQDRTGSGTWVVFTWEGGEG
jgi:hypothetical protein